MPKKISLISTLIVSTLVLAGCATAPAETEDAATIPTPTSEATESATQAPSETAETVVETTGLIKAKMTDSAIVLVALTGPVGEYAAAASYKAVLDKYGSVEPYATIYKAELRHISSLTRQLRNLGKTVPSNTYLGKITLAKDLVAIAESEAEIEIWNVEMYDELMTKTKNPNLLRLLGNLRRASLESHLPSFELAAENGGTLTLDQMRRYN